MSMLETPKSAVKKLFNALGLEIHKKPLAAPAEPVPRASMAGALRQLSALGFRPRTVIDVGVATKTEELYQAFKDAEILLIEPLVEFEPFLRDICRSYDAQYVLAAAGETPGSAVLNVHTDKFGSSLLKEVEGAVVDGVPREVPVVTIDQLCAARNLAGPYLVKVDVQGAELQVLAGATHTLQQTEAVILEVILFGTLIGGPQLADVVARMKQYGFVIYDIYGFNYRPLDNALGQVDMVFVQEGGRFRRSHAFATPEQRAAQVRDLELFFLAEQEKRQR
ncbi:MAG: FkbM family methyltransferase [Candidatus Acidiferrales bacterium]